MSKLTYGLKQNNLYHIDEVENGLKCDCVCPNCNEKLIARQGEIKEHHFAHESKECDISIAQETALHIMAKEILAEYKMIKIPKFEIYSNTGFLTKKEYKEIDCRINKDKLTKYFSGNTEEYVYSFDRVYVEKYQKDIIPDLYCEYGDIKMMIEIAVTNFINETKYNKIKSSNISTIEIDLSLYKDKIDTLNKRRLADILINDTSLKKWIYHPNYEKEIDNIGNNNRKYLYKQKENIDICCDMFSPKEYMINYVLYNDDNHTINFWNKQKISKEISMPWYIGQHIYGDFIFNIDRRIWQAFIVNSIFNSKYPTTPNSMWEYMKDKNFFRIDKNFINPIWISNDIKFCGLDVVKMYYDFLYKNNIITKEGLLTLTK